GHRFIGLGDSESGNAMAVDSNGAIVLVGKQGDNDAISNECRVAVARLKPNGDFDNSFDGDGRETITFPGIATADATGVVIQSGNKIVISGSVGSSVKSSDHDFGLMRLLPNGKLDTSFG